MQGTGANRIKRLILECIPVLLMLMCVVADQVTKRHFAEVCAEKDITVIENFFYLTYTVNTGAAWSFLAGVSWGQIFFKILTGVALVLFVLFYIYAFKKNYTWLKYALAIVVGGTVGNFIDRLMFNGVTDFLSFIFGNYRFPVFNLADTFLTIGVIMLIIHFLFLDENAVFKKKEDADEVSNNE